MRLTTPGTALSLVLAACAPEVDPHDATTSGTSGDTTDAPSSSSSDAADTGGGPTTTTAGTVPHGGFGLCGWDATRGVYACSGMPKAIDPELDHSILCPPDLPPAGAPCDQNSPPGSVGCCALGGDNYDCDGANIVVDPCGV